MNSAWWRSFVVVRSGLKKVDWKSVCVSLVGGGGLANFLATHHPQPFPEQNDKCCVVHPAVMRWRAHENILLLLMTQRKYTCGPRTGAHRSFWNSSHTSFSPRKRKTSRSMEQRCCGAGDRYCYESWRCLRCQSALSGVVNNSSSFVKNEDFTFREVLSHSRPALTGHLNAT